MLEARGPPRQMNRGLLAGSFPGRAERSRMQSRRTTASRHYENPPATAADENRDGSAKEAEPKALSGKKHWIIRAGLEAQRAHGPEDALSFRRVARARPARQKPPSEKKKKPPSLKALPGPRTAVHRHQGSLFWPEPLCGARHCPFCRELRNLKCRERSKTTLDDKPACQRIKTKTWTINASVERGVCCRSAPHPCRCALPTDPPGCARILGAARPCFFPGRSALSRLWRRSGLRNHGQSAPVLGGLFPRRPSACAW